MLLGRSIILRKAPPCVLFQQSNTYTKMHTRSKRTNPGSSGRGHDGSTSKKMQKLENDEEKISLIACGSFNPITNMHLRMFEVARSQLEKRTNKKVIRGMISPVSDGYGKKGLETSQHRIKMCSLAVKSNTWITVSKWESECESWTPTVQVLRESQKLLKDSSRLMLLCGSDLMESFNTPGLWRETDIREILENFGVVAVHRPGVELESAINGNKILSELKDKIFMVKDLVHNDTSSTAVRSAVCEKASIRYLTPDDVVEYIEEHHLYASKESESINADRALAPFAANAKLENGS